MRPTIVTPVAGGPGALDRAREAVSRITNLGLLGERSPGDALQIRVDHDAGCPAITIRRIEKCTCELVHVYIDVISEKEVALLETSGDYELEVEPDPSNGMIGVKTRRRWPKGGPD